MGAHVSGGEGVYTSMRRCIRRDETQSRIVILLAGKSSVGNISNRAY